MEEIWKDIQFVDLDGNLYDFTGVYQVSNTGRIRSLDRLTSFDINGVECTRLVKGKILSPRVTRKGSGYLRIGLHEKDGHRKFFHVHRLVAFMFIGLPNIDRNNNPQINHKDENKLNNHVSNLEWTTSKENCGHGTRNKRMGESIKQKGIHSQKPIIGVHLETGEVIELTNVGSSKTLFNNKNAPNQIRSCFRGESNSAYGYKWYYKEEYLK